MALYLDGSDDPDRAADGTLLLDDDFLVLVNAWWEPLEFVLPPTREQSAWHVELDSHDLTSPAGSAAGSRKAGDRVAVAPRSIVVLGDPRSAE
jgi:glycogen operon protein